MQKLITGFAAAAALALLASAGQACDFHATQHVTASIDKVEEGVAMSTYDGAGVPPIVEETVEHAAAAECPEDAKDCVPAGE
jgi:hypothetical protein